MTTGGTASDEELSIMRPLRYIPMLQRRPGAELCAWAVALWSPRITGWTVRRILTSSRPELCCVPCSRLGNTLPLKGWTFTSTAASCLRWRMEAAGAPKLTALLETFFVPAGNIISALMFITFRQMKIRLTSLPEADRIRIVCCQIALGSKSNAFSGPTRSINVFAHSLPFDHNIYVFPPFVLIGPC